MRLWLPFAVGAGALLAIASYVGADWDAPPVLTDQVGYRGTGMYVHRDKEDQEALIAASAAPESLYEPDPTGDKAGDVYENVQVLGHLSDDEFTHFMASITEWVSPEEGCVYCHDEEDLASDSVYTKVVSRRMIQMTQAINVDWGQHVGTTGVTCYTCHRGRHIPSEVWSRDEAPIAMAGNRQGQNVVARFAGNSSLPQNALEKYLLGDAEIRVHSDTALPTGANKSDIKDTEATWALMMHMSESLGANCVTCHNSRAFNDWDQSPPQRVSAWHGIRMARSLNADYMTPLAPVFPDNRKGPSGDVLKVGCATCHQGLQKPLNGATMLKDLGASLLKKSTEATPDFETYKPGETKLLAPTQQ